MSRLDYITMAIVAACILAIIFLVYKMTDLFDGGKKQPNTEIRADSVEVEDDEAYDYEIDESIDSTGAGAAASDKTKPAQQAPAAKTTEELDAADSPAEDDPKPASKTTTPSATTTAGGKYLVIAGTFTKRALADQALKNVQQKGFENASVEIFDRGAYAVIIVDRFDDVSDAKALVKDLSGKGVKSYVKARGEGE